VLQELDVAQVAFDVRVLKPLVERVDERLHLLRDPRRDAALRRPEQQLRAADHPAQVAHEPARHGHGSDDLSGLELPLGVVAPQPEELHVLARLRDRPIDVEAMAADHRGVRKAVLVDERDARLGVRIARHQAEEDRDHHRVREQKPEQRGRAAQHAQVLVEEQQRSGHARAAAASLRS
jgi:hypothetical protein